MGGIQDTDVNIHQIYRYDQRINFLLTLVPYPKYIQSRSSNKTCYFLEKTSMKNEHFN
jgi:hypothetical protein